MTETRINNRVDFKDVVKAWWKFFWRYAVLLVAMQLAIGLVINQLCKTFGNPYFFYRAAKTGNLFLHLLVSFLIFNSILGKQTWKSNFILVPSSRGKYNPENQQYQVGFFRKILIWWNYFWLFALFAIAIALVLGALLPYAIDFFGGNPFKSLKYTGYTAIFSTIPASLLVFMLLMWRKEKRRKLDLIKVPVQ